VPALDCCNVLLSKWELKGDAMDAAVGDMSTNPTRRTRSQVHRIRYIMGGLVCVLVFLTCLGMLYQWAASYRDRRLNPPPGLLVDANGFRMHLYCIGMGSPAVILDSGIGDSWLSWRKVQPQTAQFTRVCSYEDVIGTSDKARNGRL
jgi:hypothetical protein